MTLKSKPFVEMRQIYKSFGHVQAVRGVNLTLRHGEILGLVGDNAAGKSTLMKILFGVYNPDAGEIFIDGNKVKFDSPLSAREMGIEMIYQELSLVDDLDVARNIFLGRELTRTIFRIVDNRLMESKSKEVLESLDIDIKSVRAKVTDLSGGQRQAVAIARTITFEPKLIIMDEPTSSLSVEKTKRLLKTIVTLKSYGIGVILITHRLQDLFEVGDRIMVLWQGQKVLDAPVGQLTMEQTIAAMVGVQHPGK